MVAPAKAGAHNHRCMLFRKVFDTEFPRRDSAVWVPASAGTTIYAARFVSPNASASSEYDFLRAS